MWLSVAALLLAADPGPSTEAALFKGMEQSILNCKTFKADLEIDFAPDKDSTAKGLLLVAQDNKMFLSLCVAPPIGKDGIMAVVSDGRKMRTAGFGSPIHEQETPKNLTATALASVCRTGVYVLMDRIAQVAGPEKKLGPFDVDKQFSVSDVKSGKKETVSGKELQAFDYKVTPMMGKKPYGVTVWIDIETNLPVKRVITIETGKETVTITETYENAALDAIKNDDGLFELPKMTDYRAN